MPDNRTLRQKLAAMAAQTEASPNEAQAAREFLEQMGEPGSMREKIMMQPDDNSPRPTIRYTDSRGITIVVEI